MAEARLTASDKRALVLWIIFGIFGVVFAHKYFFQAFPEASIDFKVTQGTQSSQRVHGSLLSF